MAKVPLILTPRSARLALWSGRIGELDRAKSVVLDPFGFLPKRSPARFLWDRRGERDRFFRVCSDPPRGIPRETVDWSQIVYCDYKLFAESLWCQDQKLTLDQWLASAYAPRLRQLHISIDDTGADPLKLLGTLKGLRWQGDLIIQVFDRTASPAHLDSVADLSCWFKDSLLALDWNQHPTAAAKADQGWFADLLSRPVVACSYRLTKTAR